MSPPGSPLSPLLLIFGSLCLIAPPTEARHVSCFSEMNERTGGCVDLIGHGIEKEDCCLNIAYCFQEDMGEESYSCRPQAVWTLWSDWSACTVSCREGVQQRRRRCVGTGRCSGSERLQTRSCMDKECCAVPGGWSAWSGWGPCSVSCAVGWRERRRTCSEPPPACGGSCPGPDREVQQCVLQDICPTHGSWSPWGSWGLCGHSCRTEGAPVVPKRRRTRNCSSPAPSLHPPGDPCPGSDTDLGSCEFLPFCPVAGSWGSWTEMAPCSVSCGVGKVRQGRDCDSPAPKHGGTPCPGAASRNIPCLIGIPCPVDGLWTRWGPWSECHRRGWNISCRQYVGQQSRTRRCVNRQHDGAPCTGSIVEVRSCYNSENCYYKATWSNWSHWGLCYPPCGENSLRSRNRTCEPVYPDYPRTRGIQKEVAIFFWGYPIYECEELEGEREILQENLPCENVPLCD